MRRAQREWIGALVLSVAASALGTGPVTATDPATNAPRMPLPAELAGAAGVDVPDDIAGSEPPDLGTLSDYAWSIAESMPAEQWDIGALAESLQYDPMAAFRFVRDHIRYEPYRGTLRGAEGTLAARAGNSLDRSLLLGALLDEMLVDYSFVTTPLDDGALTRVMDAARAGAPVALDARPPGERLAVDAIAGRARRDFARLAQALGPSFPSTGGTDETDAMEAARDHVWLRIPFGAERLDLDTTLADAEPGDALALDIPATDDPPAEMGHRVELRLVVEMLQDDVLSEEVVLDQTLDAIDAAQRRIFLYFQPDLSGLGGAIVEVLSGDEQWVPVLLVDGEGVAGSPFSAGGRRTDLLGDPTEAPEPVSARLIATVTSPGEPDVEATHVLFDRRPPSASHGAPGSPLTKDELEPLLKEGGAPLALAGIHHVMVSTGGASMRTFAYYQSYIADFVSKVLLDEGLAASTSFADRLWPVALADQSLVMASEQVAVPAAGGADAHGYVARPRVYLTSIAPDAADPTTFTLITDLMIDGARILPATPGAPTAPMQVWYGALQSAIETEQGVRRTAALSDAPPEELAGGSFLLQDPLAIVTADAEDGTTTGADQALIADLAAGHVVVASGAIDTARSWWSVDPVSGVTRSMISPGLRGYRSAGVGQDREARRVSDANYTKVRRFGATKGPPRGPPGGRPFRPFRPPPPAATGGCGGTEYTIIVGCVSLPAAVVFWGLGAVLTITALYYANEMYQDWLCEPPATFCGRD